MSEKNAKARVSWPADLIEAYRLQDPVFCQFLEETGRVKSIN
jgi:hypothetical protein